MFSALYDSENDEPENESSNVENDNSRRNNNVGESNLDINQNNLDVSKKDYRWYDNETQFENFCEIYCSISRFPMIGNNEITFVRDIQEQLIESINFLSEFELGKAIRKLDELNYEDEIVEMYPERITTMKEFFFYYIIRSGLRFETREDYLVLDRVLLSSSSKVRLSSLLGITYTNGEMNIGRKFPFLSEDTKYRYVSCAYIMKYLGRKSMLDIDFPEYYREDKFLKPLNISKLLSDSNGIIFYSYKKIDKSKENALKTINYNRIMGILSFLKFNTFSEYF